MIHQIREPGTSGKRVSNTTRTHMSGRHLYSRRDLRTTPCRSSQLVVSREAEACRALGLWFEDRHSNGGLLGILCYRTVSRTSLVDQWAALGRGTLGSRPVAELQVRGRCKSRVPSGSFAHTGVGSQPFLVRSGNLLLG